MYFKNYYIYGVEYGKRKKILVKEACHLIFINKKLFAKDK